MTGRADAGTKVRIRYIPHHDHEIEVFDAASGRHLGTAHLADAASADQRRAVRQSREAEKRRLARALSAASRHTRDRFGAVTSAQRPQRLGALTAVQAEQELAVSHRADLAARALPDLIPPSEPPASWARPVKRLAPDPSTPASMPDEGS
ncbi:hypothetical protein N8I87_00015 [Streptomyces sp. HUAS TT20]|nr:hypothetical protein [Streptomyces sp. HUAS 15-9]UXY25124.1 hypothetical protein N8I87_00015 [Streptomyces sp. HUAS 15-9]